MEAEPGTTGILRLTTFSRSLVDAFVAESAGRSVSTPDLANKTNLPSDWQTACVVALFLFALRFVTHQALLVTLLKNRNERDRAKLSEALFYTVYYIAAFSYFAFVAVPNEQYLRDWKLFTNEPIVKNIFEPYPPPRSEYVQLYYMQALGFYVSAVVFLVALDTRRSDFVQLLVHHVVTLWLVSVSYHYSYTRVGALIIALHDLGDIFLYSATAFNKLGYKGVDTAVFAVFAVTFYVTRLVVLPRICYGVIIESLHLVVIDPTTNEWARYFETALLHWGTFAIMLGTLLLLHCFWFCLILRMIYRELFLGKKISDEGDIREDD